MPSLGALGAIGGAAKGFGDFLGEELKMQRQMKLEQMKTDNRRETNRIDAEMRHDLASQRDDTRYQRDISLRELEANAPTSNQRDLETLQGLGVDDAVDRIFPKRGGADGASGGVLQYELEYLQNELGYTPEQAYAAASSRSGLSKADWTASMVQDFVKSGYDDDEAISRARSMADTLFDQPAVSAGRGPGQRPQGILDGVQSLDDARQRMREAANTEVTDAQIDAKLRQVAPELFKADGAPPQASAGSAPAAAPAEAPAPEPEVPSLRGLNPLQASMMAQAEGSGVGDAMSSVRNAASDVASATAGAAQSGNALAAFLNYKRAGVPYEEMPVEVLEAYIAELEPDHPEYDAIASAIAGNEQTIASR